MAGFERPEPYEGKLSRTVLRGGWASNGLFLPDELDLNELCITHRAATFFVRASGSSMEDLGLYDGDVMVVDRAKEATHGDIVIAEVGGELSSSVVVGERRFTVSLRSAPSRSTASVGGSVRRASASISSQSSVALLPTGRICTSGGSCVISPPSRWWSVMPTTLLRSRSSGPCAGSVKSTSHTRSSCSGIASSGGSVRPAVSKIKRVSRLASPRRHARASMPRPVSQ